MEVSIEEVMRHMWLDDAETQTGSKLAQAVSLTHEIAPVGSLSTSVLIILVHGPVMIVFSTSLVAPPTGTATFDLIPSALCVAGALFRILDMDRPFNRFLRISREPMLNVLRQFGPG